MEEARSTPLLSLIVVYRNRDITRVKNCLESLAWQTNQNFELIFLDYGSSDKYSTQVQHLVNSLSFAQYFYTDTRGMFWNRSRALNTGMKYTKGAYIVTIDIDLIFSPDFIEVTYSALSATHYIRYSYYYLPKNFKQHHLLFDDSVCLWKTLKKTSDVTNYGVLGFQKEAFEKIGGYDDFYKLWGLEDIDFARRLEQAGIPSKGSIQNLLIYHQWHPKSKQALPNGWYDQMYKYYKAKKHTESGTYAMTSLYYTKNRVALHLAKKVGFTDQLTFEFMYPKEQVFVSFCCQFNKLAAGEALVVSQTFNLIKNNKTTWTSKFLHRSNQMLSKIGISYRWVDMATYNLEVVTKQEVRDFLFYFLINYQPQILDYYFNHEAANDHLYLVVVKK